MSGWRPTSFSAAALTLHAAVPPWLLLAPADWPRALAAMAGSHALLGLAALWPGNQMVGPSITCLPGRPPGLVSLSFDDGPDPDVTPSVLDLLDRHGARASFFMIGARAATHPALVREVVSRGHEVENHTMRHRLGFACLGMGGQRQELLQAQSILTRLSGRPPRLARVPAGVRSPLTDPVLHSLGLRHAAWTRRGLDTRTRDPDLVLRRLTAGLQDGDVLLLHDGNSARTAAGRPVVLETLAPLLRLLDARGLRSVPIARTLGEPACVARSPLLEAGGHRSMSSGPRNPGRPASASSAR